MAANAWTAWPSREALTQANRAPIRVAMGWLLRAGGFALLLWSTVAGKGLGVAQTALVALWIIGCGAAAWTIARGTLRHRLWPALPVLAAVVVSGFVAAPAGFRIPALVLWCGCAMTAVERFPLVAAAVPTVAALTGFVIYNDDSWLTTSIIACCLALGGYGLRQDAEARGTTLRLLEQERAARTAEAESAALAERARIAREIHDVLAHSLSAQLVHLEAARLLIERNADRQQILDQVVGARRMAQDGLAETRQALSALRGEMSPVEEYLRELVAATASAEVTVSGEARPLSAEASQAVRRVAQEALTNVRKHAPGARVTVRLAYGPADVTLHVRDSGGTPGELSSAGGGYGLHGMQERAELLGGTLEAGPHEEGFAVTLRVPA
jgi:signal transduction histidine kinase